METPCRDKLGRAQSSQGTKRKDCAKIPRDKELKLLADCQEPGVVVPPEPEPAEAQAAPRTAPVEARDAAAAEVPPERAESHDRELPLELGVLDPKGQELFDGGRTQAALVELAEYVFGLHVAVEVDELGCDLLDAFTLHGEVLGGDVAVLPVVPSGRDHLLEGEIVVDDDGVGGAAESCGLAVRRQRFTEDLAKRLLILNPPLRDGLVEIVGERAKYGS